MVPPSKCRMRTRQSCGRSKIFPSLPRQNRFVRPCAQDRIQRAEPFMRLAIRRKVRQVHVVIAIRQGASSRNGSNTPGSLGLK